MMKGFVFMKFFKKTIIFLGVASVILSGDTFARLHKNENEKRGIHVKRRNAKQPLPLPARKDIRNTDVSKAKRRPRPPITAEQTARSKGLLSKRISKYYEDRGYIPGNTGTFPMTAVALLEGLEYLRKSIPEFNEDNLATSYAVPHEKVTDMLNKIRICEADAAPRRSPKKVTPKSRSKKISHRPRNRRA